MDDSFKMPRRSVLKFGGGALLGGLTVMGLPLHSLAQGKVPEAKVLNSAGALNQTLQQLAIQQGYLEEFKVKATSTNVQDTSGIVAGIVSGQSDICMFGGLNSLFPAIESGAEIRVVGGSTSRIQQAVYSANPSVKTIRDLAGKTVGVGPLGALLHVAMVAILKKEGVDPASVKFVNIGSSSNIFKAVAAKAVDAGPSTTDHLETYEKLGLHIVSGGKLWETLDDYTFQGAFASSRSIAQNRDALVRMLAVYGKIYRFITNENSQEAFVKASVTALGAKSSDGAASLWQFIHDNKTLAVDLVLSKDSIQNLQTLNTEVGVQRTVLPFEKVADMSLAEDALKLLG